MSPDAIYDNLPQRSLKARIDGAEYLLTNLFKPQPYTSEVETIFSCISPTAVEEFLYYETLLAVTVIKTGVSFPETEEYTPDFSKESRRIIEWLREGADAPAQNAYTTLCILYFLHAQHNRKLDRCLASYYELKDPDRFLAKCLVVACEEKNNKLYQAMANAYSALFPELGTNREIIRSSIQESLFPIVSHSSFTYVLNDDPVSLFGRETLDSHLEGKAVANFRIRIQHFEDDKYDGSEGYAFPDFVDYLLHKERNGLEDYSSSLKAFWKEAVGTSRAQTIVNLRPSDIDLARFCLALGMDNWVYQRLQTLRDSYPPFIEAEKKAPKKRNMGVPTKKKTKMIQIFLKQAGPRLQEARILCGNNVGKIPRQMLVNASIQLLLEDLSGLVKVTEEEMRAYIIPEELIRSLLDKQGSRKDT